jgi:protein-S-isoprenylcysteine O-methyltransferase Ste14
MPNTVASPGVRFPPPFLHAVGFGLGMLLHRLWPIGFGSLPRSTTRMGGWPLIVLGLACAVSGFVTFARHRTAIRPDRPAAELVRSGPYRWTRNPMYVGLTTVYVGLALLVNSVWPLLLLPFVVAALVRLVIRREESYLSATFGAAYDDYRRDVRRWL